MLLAITLLLALAAGLFCARYYLTLRGIRNAAAELKEINSDPSGNRRTRLASPGKELEKLLREVNRTVEARQRERIAWERRERELRRQIANVSHDLRTPLTSILGYTELLQDPSVTAEEREEFLSIVEKRAKLLQTLITGFYDLSRLEAGEFLLEQKPVDIRGVLCELLAAFYGDFTARGFNVLTEIPDSLPSVRADENGVIRVFSNLIRNALRHGERNLFVHVRDCGGVIVTTFGNDAPAMTAEELTHVFDRFYTADRMRTGQDTGLGLLIAKGIVEEMGHTVSAKLNSGVFIVEIHWKK